MPLVNNVVQKRGPKARVWKVPTGQVYAENIRGRSPGRGVLRDQRAPVIGTRTLGRGRVAGQ
jgi:hypothetical protein